MTGLRRRVAPALLVAAAVALSLRAWPQDPEPARTSIEVSGALSGLAAGDLDGDGRSDLAILDSSTSSVTVLWNDDGGFVFSPPVGVGVTAFLIEAADMDGDGADDIVVGSIGTGVVTIVYGERGREFRDRRDIVVAVPVRDLETVDLDEDGLVDIAVGGGDRAELAIALGRPGRSFAPARIILTRVSYPHVLVAGDLGGDGHRDLCVVGREVSPPYSVVVHEGRGDGSFEDPILLEHPLPSTGWDYEAGVTGDWDSDGVDEALIFLDGRPRPGGAPGTFYLVDPSTDGTYSGKEFAAPVDWDGITDLTAGDVDGDGRPDAVAVSDDSTRAVWVLRGVGGPEILGDPCELHVRQIPERAVVSDLDGDGRVDIAVSRPDARRVEILYGPLSQCGLDLGCVEETTSACHEALPSIDVPGVRGLCALHLSMSDRERVATVDPAGVRILALEDGVLREEARFAGPAVAGAIAAGDVDRDGDPDLAVTDLAAAAVWVQRLDDAGRPDGPPRSFAAGSLPGGIALADLDGDGAADAAVCLPGDRSVAVLLATGDGGLAAPVRYSAGDRPTAVAAGYLDLDRHADLAIVSASTREVVLLRGVGGGAFGESSAHAVIEDPRAVSLADLDRDGRDDVVVASGSTSGVTILLSLEGSFRLRVLNLPPRFLATAVDVADLTGDGLPEIAVAGAGTRTVEVFRAMAAGEYARDPEILPLCFTLATGGLSVAAVDIDGNGLDDVVAGDFGAGQLVPYRSLGCGLEAEFRRGDANLDGDANLTDAVVVLGALFLGLPAADCPDAVDVNDDGAVNLSDPVFLLMHLFVGGTPPPTPGTVECGVDPTADDLGACTTGCR